MASAREDFCSEDAEIERHWAGGWSWGMSNDDLHGKEHQGKLGKKPRLK